MTLEAVMAALPPDASKEPMPSFKFRGACACGWEGMWFRNAQPGAEADLAHSIAPGNQAESLAWQEIKSHVAKSHGDQFHNSGARCDSEALAV